MRVVVDTNVFVSAALKEKLLLWLLIARLSSVLLKSTSTERELFVTLARPGVAPLIPPRFRDWLGELLAMAELVTIIDHITACRDLLPVAIRRTTSFWSWPSTVMPI